MPTVTALVTELTGTVREMIDVGVGIEVLISGGDVGKPLLYKLVPTTPEVLGFTLVRVGRV